MYDKNLYVIIPLKIYINMYVFFNCIKWENAESG